MTRNDFLKSCTAACACGGLAMIRPPASRAESENPDVEELKWKVGFAQKRFAALIQILEQNVDEPTRKKVLEGLGRDHSKDFRGLIDKYKGNLEGFLEDIRKRWVASAEYDAHKGTIRVVDKSPTCTCALVRQNLTPPSFCDCTLGWQKEVYSAIVGRPVEATLEESILRGGRRCVFRMQIL